MHMPEEPPEPNTVHAYQPLSEEEASHLLDHAVDGLELGACERQAIDLLKKSDQPAIVVLASLLLRARTPQVADDSKNYRPQWLPRGRHDV